MQKELVFAQQRTDLNPKDLDEIFNHIHDAHIWAYLYNINGQSQVEIYDLFVYETIKKTGEEILRLEKYYKKTNPLLERILKSHSMRVQVVDETVFIKQKDGSLKRTIVSHRLVEFGLAFQCCPKESVLNSFSQTEKQFSRYLMATILKLQLPCENLDLDRTAVSKVVELVVDIQKSNGLSYAISFWNRLVQLSLIPFKAIERSKSISKSMFISEKKSTKKDTPNWHQYLQLQLSFE